MNNTNTFISDLHALPAADMSYKNKLTLGIGVRFPDPYSQSGQRPNETAQITAFCVADQMLTGVVPLELQQMVKLARDCVARRLCSCIERRVLHYTVVLCCVLS